MHSYVHREIYTYTYTERGRYIHTQVQRIDWNIMPGVSMYCYTHSAVRCNTKSHNTLQQAENIMPGVSMQTKKLRATRCSTLQHTATHCNTWPDSAMQICKRKKYVQHTAALCSTLQHSAALCSTLQHSAALCNTRQCKHVSEQTMCNTLQHTAALCSTLQHSATLCNTLQRSAMPTSKLHPSKGKHTMWKETYLRYRSMWKETRKCEKRPINVKRDL